MDNFVSIVKVRRKYTKISFRDSFASTVYISWTDYTGDQSFRQQSTQKQATKK